MTRFPENAHRHSLLVSGENHDHAKLEAFLAFVVLKSVRIGVLYFMRTKQVVLCGLALLSALISLSLVYDSMTAEESSFCDVGASISCSKDRRSVFSELGNVPIAVFGFLFNCVTIYGSISLLNLGKDRKAAYYLSALFFWNAVGCLFVFYLIGAEIYLQTICPLCTVIHLLQIVMLIICYMLHFEVTRIPSLYETLLELRMELAVIVAINLIPLLLFNTVIDHSYDESAQLVDTEADRKLTECLVESGWKCFGRSGCEWCEKQVQLFANARDIFDYIDCNLETWKDFCAQFEVTAFPTWIQINQEGNEISRWKGYASVETLQTLSNCE